jgi:small subunit ribosomal protein S5
MAASATSLSTLSRFSLHHQSPFFSTTFLHSKFQSLSLSKTPKLNSLTCKCQSEEGEEVEESASPIVKAIETIYYENDDPEQISTFDPPEIPDDFYEPPSFDDGPMESEDEIASAYEEIYGSAYSGISLLGNDIYEMDAKMKKKVSPLGVTKQTKVRDGFEERVVQVRRVTKVVKGGKQMHFRAVVIVGDKKGNVGVGVGKAREVIGAVQKSATDARRNIVAVPLTKYSTFPHRANGKYGAATVMLRPAAPGSGVLAGGSVRIVLEMAGVENALGKQLGSNNALNNARATVTAFLKMRQFSEVAEERGIPMEELWK